MKPSVTRALSAARRELNKMYGDRLVRMVLYGSQARGDTKPESDVDVLVVLNGPFDLYAESKRLSQFALKLLDQFDEYVVFQPFDEKTYMDSSHPLMKNVHSEGIEI